MDRYKLVTRNIQEIIGQDDLKKILKSKKKITLYWGTMPTGSPHVAYFLPLLKIRDFLQAGMEVKILLADLHAALDGIPWETLEKRQKYYQELFPEMLKALGVSTKQLKFIKGSKIQLKPEYFHDVLKMSMASTTRDTKKAASEVVKLKETPKLGNLIYPIMQALDEEYLKADIQLGGLDQRKILVFAREFLPKIGYKPRIELMNPMIPGLQGDKMSASIPSSKIDVLDDKKTVESKIKRADFPPKSTDCGIMLWNKYIIFPILDGEPLLIERPEKFGGNLEVKTYEALESLVKLDKIHPLDIKNATAREISIILEKVQSQKLKKLHREAYK